MLCVPVCLILAEGDQRNVRNIVPRLTGVLAAADEGRLQAIGCMFQDVARCYPATAGEATQESNRGRESEATAVELAAARGMSVGNTCKVIDHSTTCPLTRPLAQAARFCTGS